MAATYDNATALLPPPSRWRREESLKPNYSTWLKCSMFVQQYHFSLANWWLRFTWARLVYSYLNYSKFSTTTVITMVLATWVLPGQLGILRTFYQLMNNIPTGQLRGLLILFLPPPWWNSDNLLIVPRMSWLESTHERMGEFRISNEIISNHNAGSSWAISCYWNPETLKPSILTLFVLRPRFSPF